ncbi:BglG family transcription antiterminator LicT [Exiguobacterium acetylicum]|uniref:BglG family transcription antiterminator LicT n=2 Tax=Exiguobacterium TaxID=33986 RepID=UPI001CA78124|nr:PRD domain-containing protein [Exiguobacterium acetylicum]QZY85472.1 PRD domain-containing protein [Exiguobacterium acetylicum]
MIIHQIFNNNVISVFDEAGRERVVMGKGIGFKRNSGQTILASDVEKVFYLDDAGNHERFKLLLQEIPEEIIVLTDDIVTIAKLTLGKKLNELVYIALADHLHFALERHEKGLEIKNVLLWEIKRLYQDEFNVGLQALELVEEKFNIVLPEDEAAYIALHIVNAELNEEMPNIVSMTKVIQEVLNLVKYHFALEWDENALAYHRFVTHLKFFAQRLVTRTEYEGDESALFDLVKMQYPKSYVCTEKIGSFIQTKYDYRLTDEEKLYLTVHITRLIKEKKKD